MGCQTEPQETGFKTSVHFSARRSELAFDGLEPVSWHKDGLKHNYYSSKRSFNFSKQGLEMITGYLLCFHGTNENQPGILLL